jgi:TetR/AcrR family transcriptional repressor of nem operon
VTAIASLQPTRTTASLWDAFLRSADAESHASLFLRALDDYITSAVGGVRTQLRDPRRSAYDRLTRHIRGQAKAISPIPAGVAA